MAMVYDKALVDWLEVFVKGEHYRTIREFQQDSADMVIQNMVRPQASIEMDFYKQEYAKGLAEGIERDVLVDMLDTMKGMLRKEANQQTDDRSQTV